ncbi:MAG: TonB-dependent receptor plug domain-containing protein [Sulfurospirillaceae bacterium]|nr:TonB-dependent receptor plug domain-containing protein [Sulfurospirillaceae bacterium]
MPSSKRKVSMLSLAVITLIFPLSLIGSDTVYELDPISTTSSGVGSFVVREDLNPQSILNPNKVENSAQTGIEIITQEDIKNSEPKNIFDLLAKATGVDVTYQGRKSPYFVNVRGGGSLTYIIDGAILPSTANKILYKLPMSVIEEIQIVRGASSLTLGPSINIGSSNSGSGLNVGYIIIKTKQPEKTEASISGTLEKSESQPYTNKENIYLGTRIKSDDASFFVGGLVAGLNQPSNNNWFDGQTAESKMANAGFSYENLSGKLLVYQDTGRFEMQRGVTVLGALDNAKWYYDPITTKIVSGDMTLKWNENHATLASLFTTRYEHTEYSNESFVTSATGVAKPYWEKTDGMSLRHNMHYGDTTVMLGVQSTDNSGFGANNSASYNRFDVNVLGWSGSVEQQLFDGALILDGGYRHDQNHIDYSSTSAARNNANNDVDMAPAKIYALGAKWNITPIYAFSTRYFHGDQGTMGDFNIQSVSGELHAEKQERLEASFEANYDKMFNPMLTWFSVKTDNEKSATNTTYTGTDGQTYYYYTESDTKRNGLELLLKGRFSTGTSYKASWTHLLQYDSVIGGITTDNVGNSNPEDLYTLLITQEWDKYRANLSIQKESGWHTSTSAMGTAYNVDLGDFTRVDTNIMRDFKTPKTVTTVTLYARNLTDEHYATRYTTGYYNDRGRVFGIDVTVKY